MDNVISFQSAKNRLKIDAELSPNRKPLYVSHATGKVTGTGRPQNFGTRLANVRASLSKIDRLINELKAMSHDKT